MMDWESLMTVESACSLLSTSTKVRQRQWSNAHLHQSDSSLAALVCISLTYTLFVSTVCLCQLRRVAIIWSTGWVVVVEDKRVRRPVGDCISRAACIHQQHVQQTSQCNNTSVDDRAIDHSCDKIISDLALRTNMIALLHVMNSFTHSPCVVGPLLSLHLSRTPARPPIPQLLPCQSLLLCCCRAARTRAAPPPCTDSRCPQPHCRTSRTRRRTLC